MDVKFEDLSELVSIGLLSKKIPHCKKKSCYCQKKSATEISVFCPNGAEFEKMPVGKSCAKSRFTWSEADRI